MTNFDIILVAPSAKGLIHHSVALVKLLMDNGLSCALLSGTEAEQHVKCLDANIHFIASPAHSIDWARSGGVCKGHVEQICEIDYLSNCINAELAAWSKFKAKLILTKNFYSVPISSQLSNIKFGTYHTGGALHLDLSRNPLSKEKFRSLGMNVKSVAQSFGILREVNFPDCLFSKELNICRGTAYTANVSESIIMQRNAHFVGALNFDMIKDFDLESLPDADIYVTFGTMIRNLEPYQTLCNLLSKLSDLRFLVTTVNVNPLSIETPKNVVVRRYVPNSLIIPKVDLVIHHGGHGTLLEGLVNGKPQIVIPQNTVSACQDLQGHNLMSLGAGDIFYYNQGSSVLRQKIDLLLSNPSKSKVFELQRRFREDSLMGQQLTCRAISEIIGK